MLGNVAEAPPSQAANTGKSKGQVQQLEELKQLIAHVAKKTAWTALDEVVRN